MLPLDKRKTQANTDNHYTLRTSYGTFPFGVNLSIEDAKYWRKYINSRSNIDVDIVRR